MSVTVRPADVAAEAQEITDLLVDYLTTAIEQLHATFDVQDSPTDVSAVRASLQEYTGPAALLLVAQDDATGRLVGVAGLRGLEPGVLEVKRMYVVPQCRGRRVGSRLLDTLLAEATRRGAGTIRLDTVRFMADAQRLYRLRGFVERSPYPGTEIPPHLQQHWIFFERDQRTVAAG